MSSEQDQLPHGSSAPSEHTHADTWQVGFISLGCPKNQVDCELMISRSVQAGFGITRHIESADAIVVNTCSFIQPAIDEATEQIRLAQRYRQRGRCKALVVAGCLPQYLQARRETLYPFVDAWLTPDNPCAIDTVLAQLLAGTASADVPDGATGNNAQPKLPSFLASAVDGRVLSTPGSYAYLKIAEGCNHRCSFCIIPQLRGRYRSRLIADLVQEAQDLLARGVQELVLVSQDSTRYGEDNSQGGLLALLGALCAIPGDFWLRVLYLHPDLITPAFAARWVELGPKLLPYFDIPVQHASPAVLQRMRRSINPPPQDCFSLLRRNVPHAVLRTSVIVGFPGETEADFELLAQWIGTGAVDHLGVFTYSDLPEMHSHTLDHHPPEAVILERQERLLAIQAQRLAARAAGLTGTVQEVILDQRISRTSGRHTYTGRSWREAPGIDGGFTITHSGPLPLHHRIMVKVTKSDGIQHTGTALVEPEPV